MTTLTQELRVIDAQQEYERRIRSERDLLRLLLREARGGMVSLQDRWKIQEIVKRDRDFAEIYGVAINENL